MLASGGIEPVSDKGKGNHSRFAYHFLHTLKENRHPLVDITYLYSSGLWKSVVDEGGQRPEIGRFKTDKDDGGQFVFMLSDGASESSMDTDIVRDSSHHREALQANIEAPEIEIHGWHENKTVFIEQALLQISVKDAGYGIQRLSVLQIDTKNQRVINEHKIIGRPGRDRLYCNYVAQLKEGDNLFRIECADQIGNMRNKEIIIHRKTGKSMQQVPECRWQSVRSESREVRQKHWKKLF
ncbi:MAG: hypothetical protein HC887_00485 [Desulfobacteraceae bacterium]|nr:hypothetical protein [Desulfobacteraceae bacterium]